MLPERSVSQAETEPDTPTLESLLQPYASIQFTPDTTQTAIDRMRFQLEQTQYEDKGKMVPLKRFLDVIQQVTYDREMVTEKKDRFPALIKGVYDTNVMVEIWKMVPGIQSEPLAVVASLLTLEFPQLGRLKQKERKFFALTAVSEERYRLSFYLNAVKTRLNPSTGYIEKDIALEKLTTSIEELPNED